MRVDRQVRVLLSEADPKTHSHSNPYVGLLAKSLQTHCSILWFSWPRAIFGRYDVLHVHWPEYLYRGADLIRRTVKPVLLLMLVVRLIISRTAVVQTVHNIRPHEAGSRVERRLLAALDRRCVSYIIMGESTRPVRASGRTVSLIPHGMYDISGDAAVPPVEGRIAFFGIVRSYKNVDLLIDVFAKTGAACRELKIAGECGDGAFAESLDRRAAGDKRVRLELQRLEDLELEAFVASASLIVLPYAYMHNSGAALFALSLGRPVLVPESDSSREWASEFGADWVQVYSGELSPGAIESALATATELLSSGRVPYSRDRQWPLIAQQTHEHYLSAVDSRVGCEVCGIVA